MKKVLSLLVAVAMLWVFSVPAMAQAEEPTTLNLPDPGITPNSFWYFFDVAMDNLALLLTFSTDARIEKELEIAVERLAEVRAMALEGEFEAMIKAESEHGKIMLKLKAEVKDVSGTDSIGELKRELEIERKIKRHRDKVGDVEEELEIEIKTKGEITPEQQALIYSTLASLRTRSVEVEIEIENEKGKTKIKIELETDRNGDEVEDELKIELGITEEEREDVLEEMTEVQEDLEELATEAEQAAVTLPDAVVATINDLLDQARTAFDAGDLEQANDLTDQADDLVDDLEDQVEDLIEESEEEDEVDLDSDEDFKVEGTIEISTGTSLVIGGQEIIINEDTEIEGTLSAGAAVEIKVLEQDDGSLLALEVEVEENDDDLSDDEDDKDESEKDDDEDNDRSEEGDDDDSDDDEGGDDGDEDDEDDDED